MSRKRNFTDLTVGIPYPDVHRLNEIAELEGCHRTNLIRLAVSRFLSSYGTQPEKEYENGLEARLKKIENRLANISVIATRASAQTLYYMTLPYARGGFPTRPLKEDAFKKYWQLSRKFASQFLKNAAVESLPEITTDSEDESKAS